MKDAEINLWNEIPQLILAVIRLIQRAQRAVQRPSRFSRLEEERQKRDEQDQNRGPNHQPGYGKHSPVVGMNLSLLI